METSSSRSHSSSPSAGDALNYNDGREFPERNSGPRVVGIGRRPLRYTGRDGWASRILHRTLYAAAAGAGAGLGVGVYKGSSHVRWMGSMSTNAALIAVGFCGSQELVRETRAADPDDPLNCIPGGLISGAVLGRLHGGPARALPCGVLFAVFGTCVQYGANQLREYRLRRFIEVQNPELIPNKKMVIDPKVERTSEKRKFPEWFPIQVLDEEAAAKRKAEKELEFKTRVHSLHKGESP